jgi:hypothetical protein
MGEVITKRQSTAAHQKQARGSIGPLGARPDTAGRTLERSL